MLDRLSDLSHLTPAQVVDVASRALFALRRLRDHDAADRRHLSDEARAAALVPLAAIETIVNARCVAVLVDRSGEIVGRARVAGDVGVVVADGRHFRTVDDDRLLRPRETLKPHESLFVECDAANVKLVVDDALRRDTDPRSPTFGWIWDAAGASTRACSTCHAKTREDCRNRHGAMPMSVGEGDAHWHEARCWRQP